MDVIILVSILSSKTFYQDNAKKEESEDTEMVEADEDEEMMSCDSCSKNVFKSSNKVNISAIN